MVHDVLEVRFRCLQPVDPCLKIYRQITQLNVRLLKGTAISTQRLR
jgi:hypothetical protein